MLCQSCLLLLFNEKLFATKIGNFASRPSNISLTVAFVTLAGSIYETRATDHAKSFSGRGGKGKKVKHNAVMGEGALTALQKLTHLREMAGSPVGVESAGGIGGGGGKPGSPTRGRGATVIKKKMVSENKIDWHELDNCFKLCTNLSRKLERIGINEEDCILLESFDDSNSKFYEVFEKFAPAGAKK